MDSKMKMAKGKASVDTVCGICSKNVDKKVIVLECGHEFHIGCLNEWANTYNNDTGLLCKVPFGESKNICFYHKGQNLLSCPV